MVKILSWNTLESGEGGAWSNGWGCPLEIQRREELIQTIIVDGDYNDAKTKAEHMLTQERYKRLRKTMLDEMLYSNEAIDFLMFQECTVGDFWDESPLDPSNQDSLDREFFATLDSLYEKISCQATDEAITEDTVQHVYVRRKSGWKTTFSTALQSNAFVGGCLAEFSLCKGSCTENEDHSSLILVNVHGKARTMRDPDLRRTSIANLWNEIGSRFDDDDASWNRKIVLCGDWNTQLSDLIEPFSLVNGDSGLEPVVGMLNNATATTDYPFFSTNHEDGFLAQYDGCLWFETPSKSSYLKKQDILWNITGFMPKGTDGKLSGDHPGKAANNFTYHKGGSREGVYLNGIFLPGSKASMGLSDHLRIYTNIKVNHHGKDGDSTDGVDMKLFSPLFQRRPYRQYTEGDASSRNEDDPTSDHGLGLRHLRG